MTYVVTENCIKCKYQDCVEVCPVDCFYEGENMLVINPSECIDCGDTSELAVLRRTEAELAIRPPPRSLYGKVYSKRYSE